MASNIAAEVSKPMRSDSESSVFAGFIDEADDEWPTRNDLFSPMDESMDELADEWEFAEADDEYDEFGEAIADEGDAELWTETADWEETGWLTEEFDESVPDHECTHCGHAVALLEAPDEEAPSGRRKLGPCTPVQDDLKPAAPWPEMQKRFRRSCGLMHEAHGSLVAMSIAIAELGPRCMVTAPAVCTRTDVPAHDAPLRPPVRTSQ